MIPGCAGTFQVPADMRWCDLRIVRLTTTRSPTTQTSLRSTLGAATLAASLKYVQDQRYLRRWLSYNDQVSKVRRSQVCEGAFSPFGEFGDRDGYAGRYVGEKLLKTLWLEDAERREPLALAYMSQITGDIWKIDHTFWSTKHVREDARMIATAQFGIVNEFGQVVSTIFTKTKGLLDPAAEAAITSSKLRYTLASNQEKYTGPRYVMTDNADIDSDILFRYLPDSLVAVLSDPFHVLLNYNNKCRCV